MVGRAVAIGVDRVALLVELVSGGEAVAVVVRVQEEVAEDPMRLDSNRERAIGVVDLSVKKNREGG
ncbi:MAG: hypothetical protein OXT09_24780, partial [Myxococcales bacterium]|nr:hypothetical protein [Myxococcales bacterium]